MGNVAAIAEHVGGHVRLFHLRLLPVAFSNWLPSYLVEARHFTLFKVGPFASLPLWAGVIGDTVGGLATDWVLRRTGNIKPARRAVAMTGLLGCAVFIVPAATTANAYVVV